MTDMTLITTDRTIMKSIEALTLAQVRRLDADPEIMRYIANGQPRTPEASEKWLASKVAYYKKNGFGLMPAFLKKNNQFIGWAGIMYLDQTTDLEIGYRLDKAYWGQGYATELVRGLINYAKGMGMNRLTAVTSPENIASKKVLEKSGFQYQSRAFYYNTDVDFFELLL